MNFKIIALPSQLAGEVRTDMVSPKYGHPAIRSVATGYGPCRHCLSFFEAGKEDRILFTYDPFESVAEFPLPGPIFIHAEPCRRYDENDGFPTWLLEHPLTVQAYGPERQLREEVRLEKRSPAEPVIERLLGNSAIDYLHIRDTHAGCYDFRVERR